MLALKQDRITISIYDLEDVMTFLEENNAYLDLISENINKIASPMIEAWVWEFFMEINDDANIFFIN